MNGYARSILKILKLRNIQANKNLNLENINNKRIDFFTYFFLRVIEAAAPD